MEAFLSCRVMLLRASPKHMFRTATTKTASEIRGIVINGSTRGRILVVCLDKRAGRWLGRKVTLHGFFGGRCIGG